MCHYIYLLYDCCSEPKEYDGVQVLNVIYCDNCPLSADGRLYGDDFFHCPYSTGECLGCSPWFCRGCSFTYRMEDDGDGRRRDIQPDDESSDEEEENE